MAYSPFVWSSHSYVGYRLAGVNLRHTLSCLENINIIVLSGRYKHYYPAWKIQTSLACLADTNTIAPSGRYKYHYPVSRVDNQRKVFFSVHIMTLMPVCKQGQGRSTSRPLCKCCDQHDSGNYRLQAGHVTWSNLPAKEKNFCRTGTPTAQSGRPSTSFRPGRSPGGL